MDAIQSKNEGDYLLKLMLDDIRAKLETKALDAIRPVLREAIEQAVESMKPKLEIALNHYKQELVVNLIFADPEKLKSR